MLIYDNNISVHDKEFYDCIQIQSLTLALHTLSLALQTHRGQLQGHSPGVAQLTQRKAMPFINGTQAKQSIPS